MSGQPPVLDDVDAAIDALRDRHRLRLSESAAAERAAASAHLALYQGLRTRQALRVAAEVDAPVPCRDCLVEVVIVAGAGSYTAGAVYHEIIYEAGELPYATCGRQR